MLAERRVAGWRGRTIHPRAAVDGTAHSRVRCPGYAGQAAMTERWPSQISRRDALGALVIAPAVAVPASVLLATPSYAYDPGRDETRSRYRETDHVKAFYRTNGYETLKK